MTSTYSTTKNITVQKPVLEQLKSYQITRKLFYDNCDKQGGLRKKGCYKNSTPEMPLISIVTVVYNGERYLEQTIKSVLSQTYQNIEYIIIDGGSTDASLDIIKKYENYIDYWISEKDEGIYDAMNKGVSLATGEYIAFLNADDWYKLDSIEEVVRVVLNNEYDFIYGDADLIKNDNVVGKRLGNLSIYKVRTPICHQALFVKTYYLMQRPFNKKHKILADYDFMLYLILSGATHYYIQKSLVNFRIEGVSSVVDSRQLNKHRFQVQKEHLGLLPATLNFLLKLDNKFLSFILLNGLKIKNLLNIFVKRRGIL